MLTNTAIAKILFRTGEILEILGEVYNAFPYYRIADIIENMEDSIVCIYRSGKLSELPGVSFEIAQDIEEIIQTGTLKKYNELLSDIPKGLCEMMDIPGMDARKVAIIWQYLGISSVDELERSAKKYELQKVSGFDAKIEIDILRSINLFRAEKRCDKILLGKALPIARNIISELSKLNEVKRVELSGSIRRGKCVVSDIDLLVETEMMPFVIKEFLHIFPPLKIIEHKEDRIVVICKEGIKIELSSVSSYNFDAVLHFTTGSKHYISNLNKYAANEELVVKDDGVYKIGTDKKFLCETEQEIYDTLKLQYIPPELREDNVEVIKKAKRYEIPSLVNLSDLKGDLHVHTTWSDGTVSVEELVQWARNKGYEYIGICDHFRPSRSTTRKGITIDNVTNLIEHVRYMRNKFYGINILVGLEVEIRKGGSLGINDELLSMFDFVIGGVHSGFDAGVEAVTDRLVAGCRHPLIDIIAHPASRMIGRRDCFVNIDKLLEAAAETDTVLEINSYIVRLDLPDIYVYQAKQNGIKFVVNTDAHTMEELNMIEYGVLTARRGWLESDDVINTLPYEKLKYVLKRNKYKGLSV